MVIRAENSNVKIDQVGMGGTCSITRIASHFPLFGRSMKAMLRLAMSSMIRDNWQSLIKKLANDDLELFEFYFEFDSEATVCSQKKR